MTCALFRLCSLVPDQPHTTSSASASASANAKCHKRHHERLCSIEFEHYPLPPRDPPRCRRPLAGTSSSSPSMEAYRATLWPFQECHTYVLRPRCQVPPWSNNNEIQNLKSKKKKNKVGDVLSPHMERIDRLGKREAHIIIVPPSLPPSRFPLSLDDIIYYTTSYYLSPLILILLHAQRRLESKI